MADVYRVTIRLAPEIYAQLEAQGRSGKPLAAIVRDALLASLAQQPQQSPLPTTAEVPTTTLAAMAASITDLQAQGQHLTARLDALAAERQPATATEQPRLPRPRTRQSQQPEPPWQPEQPALTAVPRSTPASLCSANCALVGMSTRGSRSFGAKNNDLL
jgi:hypothetical protein